MSLAESLGKDFYSSLSETTDATSSRTEIIAQMQAEIPAGQEQLSLGETTRLRELTRELIVVSGESSLEDYERYNETKNRRIEVPEAQLREQLGGKTVLVTGGTGLIGSELLAQISHYRPARLLSLSRGLRAPEHLVSGVEYLHADLRDKASLTAALTANKPDIIYHLAAEKHPAIAEEEPHRTISTNIFGTENLLSAAKDANVRQIVYASTGKATRPFSPDVYASSKKAGEWLNASEAVKGNSPLMSAGRFTHVVDNSNITQRINKWIGEDQPIRLHATDTMFYVQSAAESAQLLLLSGLNAEPDVLHIEAIRDLSWPISLTDLAIGALVKRRTDTPIYFHGIEEGYEEKAWPGLYDHKTSGDVSPLINSLEAPETTASSVNNAIDVFPQRIATTGEVIASYLKLRDSISASSTAEEIKATNQELAWALLDAKLEHLPVSSLARAAQLVKTMPSRVELTDEHISVNNAILRAHSRSSQF